MANTEDEPATTLGAALEREHRDIDGGIEEFIAHSTDGAGDPAPLVRAMTGLRRHIYLEEEFLFPPLKAAGMMMPIFVMLREHGQLWATMAGLDEALAEPVDAAAVAAARDVLTTQLAAHNGKEEPIIYPYADTGLSEPTSVQLREFLATGLTPPGWVCHAARR